MFQIIRSEINFSIHLLAAFLVNIAGWYFRVTITEWIAIWICIGMVLTAEAFNTSLEKLVDMVEPQYNERAGKVKDIAAAAVLLSALISLVVAGLIFIPRL